MTLPSVPGAGQPILDTWGEDVADAINDQHDALAWQAWPVGYHGLMTGGSNRDLTAVSGGNAGCIIVPIALTSGMDLLGYGVRQYWSALARSAELALYRDTGGATLARVTGSEATLSFTPTAPSWETPNLTGGTLRLQPGLFYLALRNTSTARGFGVSNDAGGVGLARCQGATVAATVPALGATFDPAGLDHLSGWVPFVYLRGETAGGVGPFV